MTTAPFPPITFVFLRHGEAQHNVAQREVGDIAYEDSQWRDAHLSPRGHQQALAVGEEIAARFGPQFQAIWSSPLSRCIQTALDVQQSIQAPHRVLHDSLLECLGGGHVCNDRMEKVDIVIQYPGWQSHFLPNLPPQWGSVRENVESVRMRMKSVLSHLEERYAGTTRPILIVSHHDAIQALFGVSLRNGEFHVHRTHSGPAA
jgi:broad specificity phosphatase PhoE